MTTDINRQIDETITAGDFDDRTIRLRDEAATAGDLDTVQLCQRAIGGSGSAARRVASILLAAAAMDDDR
jgi:hypothetical protein